MDAGGAPVLAGHGSDAALGGFASQAAPVVPQVHPATTLLRDILDASDLFRKSLRGDLTVNATDLEAMELLLMGPPMGPTDLSRHLGISTAATTTAVDRLVELGHVTRVPHPTDRRSVMIVPTASSRARAFDALVPLLHDLEAELAEFSDDEKAVITSYLQRVVEIYRAHAARDAD